MAVAPTPPAKPPAKLPPLPEARDARGGLAPLARARQLFGGVGRFAAAVVAADESRARASDPGLHAALDAWQRQLGPAAVFHRDAFLGMPELRGMASTFGATGGYAVPVDFALEVWDKARALDGPLARCRTFTTSTRTLRIPAFKETSRADNQRLGGMKYQWETETNNTTQTPPQLDEIELVLRRLSVRIDLTNDLMEDAPALEEALDHAAALELKYGIEEAMVNGNGSGVPLGVVNAPSTVTVDASTGSGDFITRMWKALWGPCRRNAVWLASDEMIDYIEAFAMQGGWPQGFYIPPGASAYGGEFALIKGRPLIPCEHCATRGTAGDIILGDWSQYALARRRYTADQGGTITPEMSKTMSMHVRFDTDQTALRWLVRVDGQPLWKKPITPANGGPQTGPFVILPTGTR
jgi:HK97 family phage major capsid protein